MSLFVKYIFKHERVRVYKQFMLVQLDTQTSLYRMIPTEEQHKKSYEKHTQVFVFLFSIK